MVEAEHDILSQDDATLLLYVAGELDEVDRASLDERLKSDAALRDRLAAMTALDALLCEDVAARPVVAADSRRALSVSLRLVREQALVLQSRPVVRPNARRLAGVPRWVWGTAVAASVAVGGLVWISNSDPAPIKSDEVAQNVDANGFRGQRFEAGAFGAAFLPVEAEGSEGSVAEIDNQLDALNMLAVMDQPASDGN